MNAKDEFLEHINNREILCCSITLTIEGYLYRSNIHNLHVGYSKAEYIEFIKSIDNEYDSGFGSQNLIGTIWYKDMTWSSRNEYDGSEWWVYYKVPEIPIELWRNTNKNTQENWEFNEELMNGKI